MPTTPILTQGQIDAIRNYSCEIFLHGFHAGVLEEGAIEIVAVSAVEQFGSHQTGGNGAIGSVSAGTHGAVTFNLRSFTKNLFKEAWSWAVAPSSTGTSASLAFDGTLRLGGSPRVIPNIPLVIYPKWVDAAGTWYGADVNNPMALLFPKFAVTSDLNMPFNSDETSVFPVEGIAHVDATLPYNQFGIMSEGIASDGTFTAP